jgi:Ca2+-transporting ATPase
MADWYQLSAQDALRELKTDPAVGLSTEESERRFTQYGPNELVERGVTQWWKILLSQFAETMVVILIIATIISALLGEYKDAIVVFIIVVLNALLGFRQEYQAEQAMAALKKLAVPKVRVRRAGHVLEVSARTLTPGDVVLVEAGNLVPADCRIIESSNLRVQEASLTGESEPVEKQASFMPAMKDGVPAELSLGDRRNMLYMGTVLTYGRGEALVIATGMDTQLGSIAELMQSATSEPTPLQRRLDKLGKQIAVLAFVLVLIVFGLGLLRGEDIRVLFMTAIGMAVAAVPEGLPAVITISLALGARRMLKRRALIRKLPAVEALGSVTVICSDKTGTLTENRMTVTVMDMAEHEINLDQTEVRLPLRGLSASICSEPDPQQAQVLAKMPALVLLLVGGALCNDALLECEQEQDGFNIVGDPTEGALLLAAARMGLSKEAMQGILPRLAEAPFDSERKRMTTVHGVPDSMEDVPAIFRDVWDWDSWAGVGKRRYVAFTKGAIDGLLEISDQVWVKDHLEPLDQRWRERIEAANVRLAGKGMRVLGVTARFVDDLPEPDAVLELENELVFIGLMGMIDPARPEVKDAVATCKTAGIRPIMITGDHPLTARYIADELGISDQERILTGQELERMPDDALEEAVASVSVFARVSPEHKLRIVQALQNRGQIVAMTGDGVNDAPALRKADIGVAMGITGTDVSKEAADMVLLDDNFATIVASVREGRVIYDNIRKFIQYTFTSNAGEVWVMLAAPFLGMPLPLLPIQILWINLVTDGLPGLALSVEPGEPNIMQRPPYLPKEGIFGRGLGRNVLWIGLLMGIVSLGVGLWYWNIGSPLWQTMIFTTLTLSEMGYVMAIRSERESLFKMGLFSNRALLGAVILTTLLQLAVVYVPFLQPIFDTVTLPFKELMICVLASTSLFWVVELQKWFKRRSEA